MDDIDVYLRHVTYEQKINREAEKFISEMQVGPSLHTASRYSRSPSNTCKSLRIESLERQREH
jgi:hypothetical protein